MCAGDDEVTGVVVRFVGRDGEREGEKRRGLPAPSDKLSRRLMCPAAETSLRLRAAGLPAGKGGRGSSWDEWDWGVPPLRLACLLAWLVLNWRATPGGASSEERGARIEQRGAHTDWTDSGRAGQTGCSLQQHSAQAVERPPRRDWLDWAVGGRLAARGWLEVACWRFRAGLAGERRQLPQPPCLRSQDHPPEKWAP
ncbi:uncharacterized protein K444DRAFT_636737 [Hyaloscypha bicolor E]|uniref:Uncharacterized protein n=1 Tax=Hyaloscypha bicolor E TaxID=1095630 RepID=A0A2J6SKY5_9HELO|nr:uncharacterized protein K444DRAFT_636737 [Hyaloscypha bicolor E]PMD51438.1 hypothetical protein K444DRAFT_636737 [Hyaloscypha bicolor E]